MIARFDADFKTLPAAHPSVGAAPVDGSVSVHIIYLVDYTLTLISQDDDRWAPPRPSSSPPKDPNSIATYLDEDVLLDLGGQTVLQYWDDRLNGSRPDVARFCLSFASAPGKFSLVLNHHSRH